MSGVSVIKITKWNRGMRADVVFPNRCNNPSIDSYEPDRGEITGGGCHMVASAA
jgi:hypothetical protein